MGSTPSVLGRARLEIRKSLARLLEIHDYSTMPLDVKRFSRRSPVLWHLTPALNAHRIRRTRVIESSAELMRRAGNEHFAQTPRSSDLRLMIGDDAVVLREQLRVTKPGQVLFTGGWTRESLVRELNRRVFFWPGTWDGPIRKVGQSVRVFSADAESAWIGLPYDRLLELPDVILHYCRYNSGAPRANPTIGPIPRGPRLFLAGEDWDEQPSKVKEISVLDRVDLEGLWDSVVFKINPSPT
jgi:hypothetical protein